VDLKNNDGSRSQYVVAYEDGGTPVALCTDERKPHVCAADRITGCNKVFCMGEIACKGTHIKKERCDSRKSFAMDHVRLANMPGLTPIQRNWGVIEFGTEGELSIAVNCEGKDACSSSYIDAGKEGTVLKKKGWYLWRTDGTNTASNWFALSIVVIMFPLWPEEFNGFGA
jgi:hypothetical protein